MTTTLGPGADNPGVARGIGFRDDGLDGRSSLTIRRGGARGDAAGPPTGRRRAVRGPPVTGEPAEGPDVTAVPPLDELPDSVRARVVALTAEVLPDVVRLPPSLRRVATFTASRRARLGGTAIGESLETDEEFRERVATQLAARPVEAGPDAAREAALAWLTRPEGWPAALEDAVRRLAEHPATAHREAEETERLRSRLADAEQALRDQRARQRAQVEEYKAENSTLRRKLGESRAAE